MKTYSRAYAKIDLDAIKYNIEQMRNRLDDSTEIMPIVKADGYGHGAVQIAEMLEPLDYIWGFGVATLDEAVVLRTEHVTKPILVLGCIFPDQYMEMLIYRISMNVYTEDMAIAISKLAQKVSIRAHIHIKLDTGMARLGFPVNEESVDAVERISKLPGIVFEGIFTHFALADAKDKTFTQKQLADYMWMIKKLEERGIDCGIKHCANSAGIIDVPESYLEVVRAGIATYGLYPSEEVKKENVDLKPALALKSHVAFVKEIEAGTPVSYGGTFVAPEKMTIATIPIGYGDGYPRKLSNSAHVLIRGKKAPIIGRVCMDQFMVDVSHIEGVKFGDKVTLIGKDQDEVITVEMLAELADRFNYEFICDLNKRIPRVYLQDGKIAEQVDYFA